MTTTSRRQQATTQWLLLIHQIPPKPDYLRVKIGRRLQRVGAVAVKNSVYVLPATDRAFEDFQWIRTEIIDGGGDASICRAGFVDGLTDDDVRQQFRSARDAEYAEISAAARALMPSGGARGRHVAPASAPNAEELARLRKRLATIMAIDYFAAPERARAEEALDSLAASIQPPATVSPARTGRRIGRATYRARTWVTRRDVFVDRIASAWLIRRFIDRNARFRFVSDTHRRAKGEVRFDMFDAEFTHEGDRCTFETLVTRFGFDDAALSAIAQIVHDIDLRDGKFGRDDAAGVERLLTGIVAANADDATRLALGAQLFDALYASFANLPVAAGSK